MSTTQAHGIFSGEPIECIALNLAEIEYSWKKVLEPHIKRAIDLTGGELTSEDVYEALQKGYMFAWAIYTGPKVNAVLVLEPVQLRHFRICRIVVVSGENFEDWKHFEGFIEHWARGMGCEYIDGLGRPGWVKMAAELGYKHQYTVMRKKVTLGVH
jgi:hypothetical protein